MTSSRPWAASGPTLRTLAADGQRVGHKGHKGYKGHKGVSKVPVIGPKWDSLTCDDAAAQNLAAALGIAPIVARLLCQRGLSDPELAGRFLNPSLEHLHDPMALADMGVAVDRILSAIANKERIAIHGDYDVDGVTSTVILRRALELLGADVVHFIPERLKDGYGLQPVAIDRLHADGVALVVSVDCGIRGADAARRARELGVDLIITDHHEPDSELPPALAVINPKRADCRYPDKYLAGVGVALKLVQALCRRTNRDSWLPGFIKVAAIGTLADVVPLVGENRVIAKLGLDLLTKGPHKVGLRALLDVSGLTGKTIDSYHISFMLAPRVNAAGRMSTPDIATRLLLAADETMAEEARQLAMQLDGENLRRQEEEAEILVAARKIATTDPEIGGDLTFRDLTGSVAAGVVSLAPFGAGNPRPVFAARGVEIVDGPRKLKERHLKMALKQDGRIFRAVAWRAAERHDDLAARKAGLDVAFSLEQNQYNGETFVELTIADFRLLSVD